MATALPQAPLTPTQAFSGALDGVRYPEAKLPH